MLGTATLFGFGRAAGGFAFASFAAVGLPPAPFGRGPLFFFCASFASSAATNCSVLTVGEAGFATPKPRAAKGPLPRPNLVALTPAVQHFPATLSLDRVTRVRQQMVPMTERCFRRCSSNSLSRKVSKERLLTQTFSLAIGRPGR